MRDVGLCAWSSGLWGLLERWSGRSREDSTIKTIMLLTLWTGHSGNGLLLRSTLEWWLYLRGSRSYLRGTSHWGTSHWGTILRGTSSAFQPTRCVHGLSTTIVLS